MMNQIAPREMSSCKGTLLGRPKPIPFSSCAEACDQTTKPVRCAGFQYFQFMDGDTQIPLCFLFEEMEEIRTYRCKALRGGLVLAQESEVAKKTFRGAVNTVSVGHASKQNNTKLNVTNKVAAPGKGSGSDLGDICAEIRIA